MQYTTKTSEKTGRTTVYCGRTEADFDKKARVYTQLEEQGFRITGRKLIPNKSGALVPAITVAVSNVFFIAMKSDKGGVHYALNEKNLSRYTKSTRDFKVNRANADFELAKKYLLEAFGTQITWDEFERICEETGLTAYAQAKAEAEAKAKAQQKRVQEVLANIVI